MKVKVCDICKKDDKLVKAVGSYTVRNHRGLKIDYCGGCKNKIPNKIAPYTKMVYGILYDTELTDEEAKKVLKG